MVTLFTPDLIVEVAEAVEDYQITAKEFSSIISVITSIFAGVMLVVFVGMLMGAITKETGISTRKVAGVTIPIL